MYFLPWVNSWLVSRLIWSTAAAFCSLMRYSLQQFNNTCWGCNKHHASLGCLLPQVCQRICHTHGLANLCITFLWHHVLAISRASLKKDKSSQYIKNAANVQHCYATSLSQRLSIWTIAMERRNSDLIHPRWRWCDRDQAMEVVIRCQQRSQTWLQWNSKSREVLWKVIFFMQKFSKFNLIRWIRLPLPVKRKAWPTHGNRSDASWARKECRSWVRPRLFGNVAETKSQASNIHIAFQMWGSTFADDEMPRCQRTRWLMRPLFAEPSVDLTKLFSKLLVS